MGINPLGTHGIHIAGCRDDRRVEEKRQEFDDHVHIEEMDNFFATYIIPVIGRTRLVILLYLPTAVYLLLIW